MYVVAHIEPMGIEGDVERGNLTAQISRLNLTA